MVLTRGRSTRGAETQEVKKAVSPVKDRKRKQRITSTVVAQSPDQAVVASAELLVSVILSAQTTDKKVNEVTPALFRAGPDAHTMALLKVPVIEDFIRQVGLAPTKAKNLSKMSKMLVEKHGGSVPRTFEELELLAGVGHKTASVVMAVAFGLPTFPVDTHIHRLAQRWGLTDGKNVEQTEVDLKLLWPEENWNPLHLRLIYCGRELCPAMGHDPTACPLCSWAAVAPFNRPGQSPLKAGQARGKEVVRATKTRKKL
ncbi:hypothetical protein WJX73_010360 [Symbiochloris irregularis]|uniref:HhH-GPD domain-containing protein n=1 Tax=Symbiochloris irregularis TaxID=706552 RepID=A0AAW1NZZ6_9CHLO